MNTQLECVICESEVFNESENICSDCFSREASYRAATEQRNDVEIDRFRPLKQVWRAKLT